MNTKRLAQIEGEIEKIKMQLQKLEVIRPGSLTRQYRNPKEKKGGFYQLSYTHKMRSKTEYVRPEFLDQTRKQIKDYKRLRELIEKWIALSIEYSRLSMKLRIAPSPPNKRKGPKQTDQ